MKLYTAVGLLALLFIGNSLDQPEAEPTPIMDEVNVIKEKLEEKAGDAAETVEETAASFKKNRRQGNNKKEKGSDDESENEEKSGDSNEAESNSDL
jgi:hypothetical protein